MKGDEPMREEERARGGRDVKRLALVASKGTLDMAYPPLTMATTAASMGWEVGVFFTFYGLDIVTRGRADRLAVSAVGNPAMPAPISSVPVRVPTLVGVLPGMTRAATSMMKGWMADANMATVDELLEIARELGVRLFACNTTLRVMRVDAGDLIEGVECVGAPAFLDFAAGADVQLFV